MLLTCKCLNIIISAEDNTNVQPFANDKLSSIEKQNEFFKTLELGCIVADEIYKKQPFLVHTREVDSWLIYRCLNCLILTYAIPKTELNGLIVFNKSLVPISKEELEAIKKGDDYSNIFEILISDFPNDKGDIFGLDGSVAATYKNAVYALCKQLSDNIQKETAKTEEIIARFTEDQYSHLQEYKTHARNQYDTLISFLNEKNSTIAEHAKLNVRSVKDVTKQIDDQEILGPKRINQPLIFNKARAGNNPKLSAFMKNDEFEYPDIPASLDTEGLFLLDDTENTVQDQDEEHSEEEQSDTDDSGKDEGIHIPRVKNLNYARSLPIKVALDYDPAYHHWLHEARSNSKQKQQKKETPKDIAANIKALASSVHGDALFGDLPPPRIGSRI